MHATHQPTLWEWARPHLEERAPRTSSSRAPERVALSRLPQSSAARQAQREAQARALHQALESRLGPVRLVVTANRRRMVSSARRAGGRELRVHERFLGCEPRVADALAGFVRGEPSAREALRAFVMATPPQAPRTPAPPEQLRVAGRCHDLSCLMRRAARLLGSPRALDQVQITWGRRGRGQRSILLGSYDFGRKLVRIHPALDQAWVPAAFVEFVIYHELIHALCPPEVVNGRRKVHTEAFKALERRFPCYEEALAWERANLHRLLESP